MWSYAQILIVIKIWLIEWHMDSKLMLAGVRQTITVHHLFISQKICCSAGYVCLCRHILLLYCWFVQGGMVAKKFGFQSHYLAPLVQLLKLHFGFTSVGLRCVHSFQKYNFSQNKTKIRLDFKINCRVVSGAFSIRWSYSHSR